jgi:hypothetical protein
MGFFCYSCNKKVRGQPNNHGCTKRKYGNKANDRIYDKSGNKRHRFDRRNNKGKYNRKHKGKHSEDNIDHVNGRESDLDDLNDRDLTQLKEWRDIVHQWDLESSRGCKGMYLLNINLYLYLTI